MTTKRKAYLKEKLKNLLQLAQCTRGQFESIVGIISFCRSGINCLQDPLQALDAKQTVIRRIMKSKWQIVKLSDADTFVCKWLLYLLNRWEGKACIFTIPDITINSDIGALRLGRRDWGIGAYCFETKDYVSSYWSDRVVRAKI